MPTEKIQVNLQFANNSLRLVAVPVANTKKKSAEPTEEDKDMDKGIKNERQ